MRRLLCRLPFDARDAFALCLLYLVNTHPIVEAQRHCTDHSCAQRWEKEGQ